MTDEELIHFHATISPILEGIHQVLFSVNWQQNEFIYLSPAYSQILETPVPDHLKATSWLDSIYPEDRNLEKNFFEKMTAEKQEQLECRVLAASGMVKWIRIDAKLSNRVDNKLQIVVGTIEDISSRQEYRATTQHFTDRKNSLLQLLSHDLLGPLGNIQFSAKMLAEGSADDAAGTASMLKIILQNCTRSVNLIQNLVNDEFLTTSKSDLIKQRVEMVSKLRLIINEFAESPNVGSQQFEFICAVDKLYINIDEAKFTQVIINLLSNALKFTGEAGIIQLQLEEKDDAMQITVQDNGIGIPEELQPYLFDKFTRARRPGLRGEPTIGLGLSIIKRIVEWHQGQIWMKSEEGKGTSFFISIPLLKS